MAPDSPASMDCPIPSEDYGSENDLQLSPPLSPPNLAMPDSDVADNQSPSPEEDLRLYSQTINKVAKVMGLQVEQPDTDDTCNLFGHLKKNRAPPLRLGFIPSLLKRSKSAFNTPSSMPHAQAYRSSLQDSWHVADMAAKQIATGVYLHRRAWLHTETIMDDAQNRIEDSPFDGERLFAATTDELLDIIFKKRKMAHSYLYQGNQTRPMAS
ncbi:hypothetical protein JRQ81_015594 [Phrynocephalus forsythii]|uniref:Uncharacterized protein n=1 Tax=Phrynocephalus forsythii TaxID=171643 RepID=A0A9Q1B1W7_9SAUR|nr:hypothetical protein JRQ81_015594 [Phrynocephalus forsythii]